MHRAGQRSRDAMGWSNVLAANKARSCSVEAAEVEISLLQDRVYPSPPRGSVMVGTRSPSRLDITNNNSLIEQANTVPQFWHFWQSDLKGQPNRLRR
jgi:hypothetical protein